MSRADRPRPDSWLAVDLRETFEIARVRLHWESAYGAEYGVQVSHDGVEWHDATSVPRSREFPPEWVNVDDRAGFVVHGSSNPIRATATSLTLSAGPVDGSTGAVIEGYPGVTGEGTKELAAAPTPVTEPAALAASTASEYLSMFNLSAQPLAGSVRLERTPGRDVLYAGRQEVSLAGHVVEARLDPLAAQILPRAFTLEPMRGTAADDVDLRADVLDAATVELTGPGGRKAQRLRVTALATGEARQAVVPPGRSVVVRFAL